MSWSLSWNTEVNILKRVSVESYQFVLSQAKEKLDEVVKEAHAITSSAMKVLLVYVTGVPGISGYIFSGTKNFQLDLISAFGVGIFALFAIYIFTLLISLIAPERILQKGSEPKVTFQREIFLANDSQIAFKNLLFNEIDRIQDKIERIKTNNKKRVSRYKSVLRASLILVAVLVFALVKKLFTGS